MNQDVDVGHRAKGRIRVDKERQHSAFQQQELYVVSRKLGCKAA
jgi:hypothetical protein